MPKTTTKTTSALTQKKPKNSTGAPSQLTQGSRKGKKAWRKNVDIEDVEQGLEHIRAEERVIGSAVHQKANEDLFAVDVTGDDRVRRSLPKFSKSQLSSSKILAQRSAIPAVTSRVVSSANTKRVPSISHADKGRLLRMGKKNVRGPLNAVMDPTEFGAGSALLEVTEAVKESGKYNVWEEETELSTKVRPPPTSHPRSVIDVPAVAEPHQGTSYNPPVSAHQELLRTAHEIEEQRSKTAEEHKVIRDRVAAARHVVSEETDNSLPTGMALDAVEDDQEPEEQVEEVKIAKPRPERKTKQQRRKAEKQRVEKRALAEKLAKKRLLTSVTTAKALRKSLDQSASERERVRVQKQHLLKEKLKRGLAGSKLGKHVVKEGDIDVQLGEDLSESLRGLKPEGNLFRDRFISMQHRALVEPRVPVLPSKTRVQYKETEKHAWKRFDLES